MLKLNLLKKIKIKVVTDTEEDLKNEVNEIETLKLEKLLLFLEEVERSNNIDIYQDKVLVISNGEKLVSLQLLNRNIFWSDIFIFKLQKNYYRNY